MTFTEYAQIVPQMPQSHIRGLRVIEQMLQQPAIDVRCIGVPLNTEGAAVKPIPIFEFLQEPRKRFVASASQLGGTPLKGVFQPRGRRF